MSSLIFSQNSKNIVAADVNGVLSVVDIDNAKFKQNLLAHADPVEHLEFSQKDDCLMSAGSEFYMWHFDKTSSYI